LRRADIGGVWVVPGNVAYDALTKFRKRNQNFGSEKEDKKKITKKGATFNPDDIPLGNTQRTGKALQSMNRITLAILLIFQFGHVISQSNKDESVLDFRSFVKPVYEGKEGTALSVYDTNPESPNGEYICYIKYPQIVEGGHFGPPVKADVMIMNLSTGKFRKIYQVNCTNHNGANAIWVNDSLVAFQVNDFKDFVVYNIRSDKSVFGIVEGELGHKSFGNVLVYTVCNVRLTRLVKNRVPYDPDKQGIYSLDCITGNKRLLVSKKDIVDTFIAQNPNVRETEAMILHVEPNKSNDKIMFDYRHLRYPDKTFESLHGFLNADGSGIRWVTERPMHVVWFDEDSMFGVDTKDPEKKIYKYDLYGRRIEMLGGRSTHVGASPDRKWYIGESAYYQPEEDGITRVYLYKRGNKKPYALLAEMRNSKITWNWVAHVNPSYSSDGKRAYFIRSSDSENKFEAVCIDFEQLKLD
jgi:hypothetical protein